MPTFTELMPAQRSSKHNGFRWTPTCHGQGLLMVDTDRCRCRYLVSELPLPAEEPGRSFRLVKIDAGTDKETPVGDSYTVFLPANGPVQCDCKGFIYGNGKYACKHILACLGLIENRWL